MNRRTILRLSETGLEVIQCQVGNLILQIIQIHLAGDVSLDGDDE